MSVGSYEVSSRPPVLAHRMAQWSGARPNWRAAGGSNRGSGIRFFQDGFTAYPVHIRVFGPASAPSSSQFIHFLDRPTGRDPQDLSAPLDGLCAYIPGSCDGLVMARDRIAAGLHVCLRGAIGVWVGPTARDPYSNVKRATARTVMRVARRKKTDCDG